MRWSFFMNQKEITDLTEFFKVLSNPIRLKILMHIAECKDSCHKHNISELSKDCEVDFSVVSRHLKALKDVGILVAEKNKNDVIYSLDRDKTKGILQDFNQNF